jgi:hypothetical protein
MRKLWRTFKENWANYILEMVIIILGLSISFYVESIREGWQEQKEKKKVEAQSRKVELNYLKSLQSDVEKDLAQLDSLSIKAGKVQMLVYQFRQHMDTDSFDVDQVYTDLYQMSDHHEFWPNSATYDALLSSSDFTKISNYQLKESLIGLHHFYKTLHNHDLKYVESQQMLFDYLFDKMDNSAFELTYRKIPLKGKPRYTDDAAFFLKDIHFANRLRSLNYIYFLTVDYGKAKTLAKELLEQLKAEIEQK